MKESLAGRLTRVVVLGILVSACAGCLGLTAESKLRLSASDTAPATEEKGEPNLQPKVVKASAPPKSGSSVDVGETNDSRNQPRKALSEEEKARSFAVDLAKAHPDVKKIKVCHDQKNDEWWLVLYEDSGDYFRLRQYTWSVSQDQPEEFLVLKRISKSKLDSHLRDSEHDRVCQVVEYGPSKDLQKIATGSTTANSPPKSVITRDRPATEASKKVKPEPLSKPAQVAKDPAVANPPKDQTKAPPHSPKNGKNAAAVQAVAKPRQADAAPRKAVAGPDSSAFTHATARNSPAAIASGKDSGSSRQRMAAPDRAVEKAAAPKAKIISDAGVFAIAAVRPQAKPRSQPPASDGPVADKAKKQPQSDATSALTDYETLPGSKWSDRSPDQRDVPSSWVFVYGSGMNHQELMTWLKANNYDSTIILDATPAVLEDYDLVWNYYSPSRGGGTVNLEPSKNARVWGLLVEVEDRGLKALDKKEGHPVSYVRGDNRVCVKRVSDGQTVFAWLYRAKPHKSGKRNIWPTEEYKRKLVEAANFWQFPRQYIGKLESLPTR
jgi:gamma-glutamylcyclotransferase (GGCT)/AIG2-like uncharacterized protein YtfP